MNLATSESSKVSSAGVPAMRPFAMPAVASEIRCARFRVSLVLLAESVRVLYNIMAYLDRRRPHVLSTSPEGQAVSYAMSNWEALVRYCEDGDLETDNNGTGRSLRGIAVAKKLDVQWK